MCSVGTYVPIGGKKLLTFMDDLNMPAKDTFGSQPPLELIRQWIDYGFWYDRAKQTVKQIKVSTTDGRSESTRVSRYRTASFFQVSLFSWNL